MKTISMDVVINRPVETVFAALNDARSQTQWDPGLLERRHDPDGPARLFTRITEVRRFMGRTMETDSELVEFELNKRFVRKGGDPTLGKLDGTLTFEPSGAGTRINWTWQLDMPGVKSVMEPLMAAVLKRQGLGGLANLKELLERDGLLQAA
jgi:uncharacterized protein YndB with AHSA1/START domain